MLKTGESTKRSLRLSHLFLTVLAETFNYHKYAFLLFFSDSIETIKTELNITLLPTRSQRIYIHNSKTLFNYDRSSNSPVDNQDLSFTISSLDDAFDLS